MRMQELRRQPGAQFVFVPRSWRVEKSNWVRIEASKEFEMG